MDLEKVILDSERWVAGKEILAMTDRLGFVAPACAWIFMPETEAWRFYLITPMLDEQGPRWIHDRLIKVFNKVDLPSGITPLDIFVGSPRDKLFRHVLGAGWDEELAAVRKAQPESQVRLQGVMLPVAPGIFVAKAVFYRIQRDYQVGQARVFDKRVSALLAA